VHTTAVSTALDKVWIGEMSAKAAMPLAVSAATRALKSKP
jgi:hypothetical protein